MSDQPLTTEESIASIALGLFAGLGLIAAMSILVRVISGVYL